MSEHELDAQFKRLPYSKQRYGAIVLVCRKACSLVPKINENEKLYRFTSCLADLASLYSKQKHEFDEEYEDGWPTNWQDTEWEQKNKYGELLRLSVTQEDKIELADILDEIAQGWCNATENASARSQLEWCLGLEHERYVHSKTNPSVSVKTSLKNLDMLQKFLYVMEPPSTLNKDNDLTNDLINDLTNDLTNDL